MEISVPKEVRDVGVALARAGFEAYIVGGCVRDLLMGREPDDWDITTNAKPEDIQKLFTESFYENAFGTVTVVTESKKPALTYIEVTPYRAEAAYRDRRHPDNVTFAPSLEIDLQRRDFTVNAMALKLETRNMKHEARFRVVDLFGGEKDIARKIVRAVGDPEKRFEEDALRLMRAVRIAAVLGFSIEPPTEAAIKKHAGLLAFVSKERVRDELIKLLGAREPDRGLDMLRELGLLPHILPELLEGWGITQNKHHIYTVWEHNLRALRYAADQQWSLEVRMAALLHDVAKPRTKRGEGVDATFYGHDVVGAEMAAEVLDRLRFPKQFTEKVAKLVRHHLFYYNVGEVSESSVRRLIRNVGVEDMEELIEVRMCDRMGSGVPKAEPYKLRHFRFLVEKLMRDPVSVKMLRIKGEDVMRIAGIPPGPKVGFLLNIALEDVLDDPLKNRKEYLEKRIAELAAMSDKELNALAEEAKRKAAALEESEVGEIKKKHWVK